MSLYVQYLPLIPYLLWPGILCIVDLADGGLGGKTRRHGNDSPEAGVT